MNQISKNHSDIKHPRYLNMSKTCLANLKLLKNTFDIELQVLTNISGNGLPFSNFLVINTILFLISLSSSLIPQTQYLLRV